MARILILVILGFLIYLLLRGFFRSQVKKDEAPPPATTIQGEDMVKCARCGVNLPRSDTVEAAGRLVCRENPLCVPKP